MTTLDTQESEWDFHKKPSVGRLEAFHTHTRDERDGKNTRHLNHICWVCMTFLETVISLEREIAKLMNHSLQRASLNTQAAIESRLFH